MTPINADEAIERVNTILDELVTPLVNVPGGDVLLLFVALQSRLGIFGDANLAIGEEAEVAFAYSETKYNPKTQTFDPAPARYLVYLDCSDCFFWGSADSEELTMENWPVFVQVIRDVYPLYVKIHNESAAADERSLMQWHLGGPLCELFAARVRGERPQGASYSYFPIEMWPWFDACGPHRVTGLGNPTEPGDYKGPWSDYNKKHAHA